MIGLLGVDAAKLPPIREPIEILGAVTAEAASETGLQEGDARAGRRRRLSDGAARLGRLPARPRLRRDRHVLHPHPDRRRAAARSRNLQRRDDRGPLGSVRPARDRRRRDALGAARLPREGAELRRHDGPRRLRPGRARTGCSSCPISRASGSARIATRARSSSDSAPAMDSRISIAPSSKGVAFAAARHLRIMEKAAGRRIERVIASGGGAKTQLWLKIKASVYDVPIVVPKEPECGVIGCAALAATATGRFARTRGRRRRLRAPCRRGAPDPRMGREPTRGCSRSSTGSTRHSQALYDDLDAPRRRLHLSRLRSSTPWTKFSQPFAPIFSPASAF